MTTRRNTFVTRVLPGLIFARTTALVAELRTMGAEALDHYWSFAGDPEDTLPCAGAHGILVRSVDLADNADLVLLAFPPSAQTDDAQFVAVASWPAAQARYFVGERDALGGLSIWEWLRRDGKLPRRRAIIRLEASVDPRPFVRVVAELCGLTPVYRPPSSRPPAPLPVLEPTPWWDRIGPGTLFVLGLLAGFAIVGGAVLA